MVLILTRRLSPLVTRIRLNSQDLRRISLVTKGLNPTEFANIAGAENEVWWYRGIRRTLFGILDPLVKKRDLQTALEDGCGAGYDAAAFEQRSGQTIWLQRVIWFLVICAGLFLTRWKLTPAYLVTFDEINFALAVDQFDPALHQPQPPGYPLFVGLLKLLALALPNIETTFLMAALLVSAAALIFLWGLCEQMLGSELGLLGPLLLLFNPAFWTNGREKGQIVNTLVPGPRPPIGFFEAIEHLARPGHHRLRKPCELGNLDAVRTIRCTRLNLM